MGAPLPDMEPVENASAEALLSSLKTIDPGERRKHASVFNYWLSIRANRQFPPIRDLDPLEISDAGPWSVLLEMIGGGEDAVVRHLGQAIKGGLEVEKIGDAPSPSLLACIHAKLPIVAACREAYAFEESFETDDGPRRCWVTLLPFSATGTWIDFVYGYVSLDGETAGDEAPAREAEVQYVAPEIAEVVEVEEEQSEVIAEAEPEPQPQPFQVPLAPLDEEPETGAPEPEAAMPMAEEPEAVDDAPEPEVVDYEPEPEAVEDAVEPTQDTAEPIAQDLPEPEAASESALGKPSFSSKLLGGLANSFYGKVTQTGATSPEDEQPEAEPVAELLAVADEIAAEEASAAAEIAAPASDVEGNLQSKLSEVRALAEEAREAQIRSNIALYEGLSAAYDFALDAEDAPEEYLRLVEGQGLKIQLRQPMKPVVKLAFDGMCDEPTIKQLEAVLAWALKQDLPKGTLAERIQAAGGIGAILNGAAA